MITAPVWLGRRGATINAAYCGGVGFWKAGHLPGGFGVAAMGAAGEAGMRNMR